MAKKDKVTKPVVTNPDILSRAHDYEKAIKANKKNNSGGKS